jgi:lysozyme family protein
MATFEVALPTVLLHEGGYVNNPADPGGATNWGVSLRYLKALGDANHDGLLDGDIDRDGDVDIDDIRLMSSQQAGDIYKTQWWDRYGYGHILDQTLATKILDLAVNMGAFQVHKILQRAILSCGKTIVVDGVLGPKSFEAINSLPADDLLFHVRDQAAEFYRSLVIKRPKSGVFLKGWLRRAYS